MHTLIALAPLLACPLAMLAMGAIGWFGAKRRRRANGLRDGLTGLVQERKTGSSA
jgi:hypothetical protein